MEGRVLSWLLRKITITSPNDVESKLPLFTFIKECGIWSLNPYPKCDHSCSYCITGVQGSSSPIANKESILNSIEKQLRDVPKKTVIFLGGISDAYPSEEKKLEITREIIRFFNQEGRSYVVITKSNIVERDLDLIGKNPNAAIDVSLCSLNDKDASILEPGAPAPSLRLAMLKRLAKTNIRLSVSAMPWLPGITDLSSLLNEIPETIPIKVDRLKITRKSRTFVLRGRTYRQDQIDDLYLKEMKKFGGISRIQWNYDKRFSQTTFESNKPHPIKIALKEDGDFHRQLEQLNTQV